MDDIYTMCKESLNSLKGDDTKTCVLCLHLLMGGAILKLCAIKKSLEKKKYSGHYFLKIYTKNVKKIWLKCPF